MYYLRVWFLLDFSTENGTKFIKDVVLMKGGTLSNKKPSNGNEPKQEAAAI